MGLMDRVLGCVTIVDETALFEPLSRAHAHPRARIMVYVTHRYVRAKEERAHSLMRTITQRNSTLPHLCVSNVGQSRSKISYFLFRPSMFIYSGSEFFPSFSSRFSPFSGRESGGRGGGLNYFGQQLWFDFFSPRSRGTFFPPCAWFDQFLSRYFRRTKSDNQCYIIYENYS